MANNQVGPHTFIIFYPKAEPNRDVCITGQTSSNDAIRAERIEAYCDLKDCVDQTRHNFIGHLQQQVLTYAHKYKETMRIS